MGMDRKEFLTTLGKGAAVVAATYCLGACSSNSNPTAPSNVDFTLDLTQPNYQTLNSPGGVVLKDGIIIARVNFTSIVAVASACTHEGTQVQFDLTNSRFHCPTHGSNFKTDGSVINGPAGSPLKKYNTTLNGNSLRVFS